MIDCINSKYAFIGRILIEQKRCLSDIDELLYSYSLCKLLKSSDYSFLRFDLKNFHKYFNVCKLDFVFSMDKRKVIDEIKHLNSFIDLLRSYLAGGEDERILMFVSRFPEKYRRDRIRDELDFITRYKEYRRLMVTLSDKLIIETYGYTLDDRQYVEGLFKSSMNQTVKIALENISSKLFNERHIRVYVKMIEPVLKSYSKIGKSFLDYKLEEVLL